MADVSDSGGVRDPAGAPEDRIEITTAMIEAGALALSEYTSAYETLEDGAERIYRRMNAAWLQRAKNDCGRV